MWVGFGLRISNHPSPFLSCAYSWKVYYWKVCIGIPESMLELESCNTMLEMRDRCHGSNMLVGEVGLWGLFQLHVNVRNTSLWDVVTCGRERWDCGLVGCCYMW
jgi:hypothetical protein